ncbi:hypothetical protein C2845_PM13G00860 [Panicum miliaceum]|uniref:Uncharacterized protein n=1 Tax=Panicum miliaceum TaxID=4540 RepID=A0A3L6RI28_PANMI|nr:hypothetical protein C2845_PM13G00860 [Panicum miliaceum]
MQDITQRRPDATTLKVTALVSTATQHHLELQLVHENLSNFAAQTRIPFQFSVFNLDAVELLAVAGAEAIAVHLPAGSVPSSIHLVKRLGAKLVVSADRSEHVVDLRVKMPLGTR